MGLGPLRRATLPPEGGDAPPATALLAMTAHRRACPAAQWAGDDHWRADDVYGPEAKAWARAPRSRAMDCLRRPREAIAPELGFRTAALFNAEVARIGWETTPLSCESDAADDEGEPGPTPALPALRPRGHHHEGREGTPPVVVGLALSREGLPVRSWVLPGPPAAVPPIDDLKADVRGWRWHRGVVVGESGMCAAANRPRRSRALGRDLLAGPRRQVPAGPLAVRTRAGRSRHVPHTRRVQAVYGGAGERRRRSVVCHHPDEAAREQAQREHLLELVRAERAALEGRPAHPPTHACALRAARRFGRSLRRAAGGRLRLDRTTVAAEAP